MIAYLSGTLAELQPTHAVVECAGVGYWARISLHTYQALQGKTTVRLHTRVQTKEDGQTLFGFAHPDERSLFDALNGVPGVGGSVALALLSAHPAATLQRMLVSGDTGALKRVKGVGTKTAERLVLELKDKLGAVPGSEAGSGLVLGGGAVRSEALQALATLGYPRPQVTEKVDTLLRSDPNLTVEALIKAVLRGG